MECQVSLASTLGVRVTTAAIGATVRMLFLFMGRYSFFVSVIRFEQSTSGSHCVK